MPARYLNPIGAKQGRISGPEGPFRWINSFKETRNGYSRQVHPDWADSAAAYPFMEDQEQPTHERMAQDGKIVQ
jgi:hypothetical protein